MKCRVVGLFLSLALSLRSGTLPPLGVNAHLAENEYGQLVETCEMMKLAGVQAVRFDVHWRFIQPRRGAPCDFSRADRVFAELKRNGLKALPILGVPRWVWPPKDDFADDCAAFAKAFAVRYKGRFDTLEVLNEPNNARELNGENTIVYARALKAVCDAVKEVDPAVRISFAGIGGDFSTYLRKVYELGYGKCFDIVNLHPYTNPLPPEADVPWRLESQVASARKVMSEFGDADKPIIATEIGWSTQADGIGNVESAVFATGLKLARPERKKWRGAYIEPTQPGKMPSPDVPRAMLGLLPPGSTMEAANEGMLLEMLKRNELDCVVFPVRNESYPASVAEAVIAFVRQGGVLVELGGIPLLKPDDPKRDAAADRRALRLDVAHSGIDGSLPAMEMAFATDRAKASGFTADLGGYKATRFLKASLLKPGDELIPLVATEVGGRKSLVAAGVYKFNSDMKGAVIVSALITLHPAQQIGTVTEEEQANYLVRAFGSCLAMGVESGFVYEFRSPEGNPYYSECHFGIVHDNFAPKPAFAAFKTLAELYPDGCKTVPGKWHDEERVVHAVRWKRPDGREAGMFWSYGRKTTLRRKFNKQVKFLTVTGLPLPLPSDDNATYTLPLGGSPILFVEK